MSSTYVTGLILHDWRQFGEVSLDLSSRITIITGANGAGKSTILSLINKHYGFERPLYGISDETRRVVRENRLKTGRGFKEFSRKQDAKPQNTVGKFQYSNGSDSLLQSNNNKHIEIVGQRPISGTHVDSHSQPILSLSGHRNETFVAPTMKNIAQTNHGILSNGYSGEIQGQQSPINNIKSSLIRMVYFGFGNDVSPGKPDLRDAFEKFQGIVRKILPPEIGFESFLIDPPEIIVSCQSGDFPLEACSGGVIKSILVAWQIFLAEIGTENLLVTLDEPENHLHPAMQKSFLQNMTSAFPRCRFIIATHSPFIVSASPDSRVYTLRYSRSYQERSKVGSFEVKDFQRAGPASEILRDVLGVESTIPNWAGDKLEAILANYRNREPSQDVLDSLFEELSSLGLERSYPDAMGQLFK